MRRSIPGRGLVLGGLLVVTIGAILRLALEGPAPAGPSGAAEHGPSAPRASELLARIRAKQRIVDDLLAGHLSSDAALARFHALNHASPLTLVSLRRQWPDLSEDEMDRRNLEMFIRTTRNRLQAVGAVTAD